VTGANDDGTGLVGCVGDEPDAELLDEPADVPHAASASETAATTNAARTPRRRATGDRHEELS
jgi:hypothetical protein